VGLLLGLGLVAAALFTLANATGYGIILAAMAVMGMGGGIIITGANALGSDVSESRRAAVLNFLNVFVGLGGFATPFVAGNLLSGDAIRVAYGAALITTATFIVHLFLRIPPPTGETNSRSADVFRRPLLYMLASVTFLYTACEFGIWNWLVKYLISRGIPESSALNILGFGFAIGLLLGRVAVLPVLMKIKPLSTIMTAAGLMALTTLTILMASDRSVISVAVFCAGLAMAPVFPTTVAIVGDSFKQGSATAIGFTITCGFSGLVVSSPLIGWLAGADPNGIGKGLAILPVFSLLIIGVSMNIRSQLKPVAVQAATF
jgi:FHS family L-fucose permease-like MFS transporter